ncbi:MAG: hypothetical protein RLZZ603_449 [Actinomycetota bacterium]
MEHPQAKIISPRAVKLTTRTGVEVQRLFPQAGFRKISAWCFLDHFGPTIAEDAMVVAAHPHTGLQTATWLLEGMVEHRDSIGSVQTLVPGEFNLMTAGRGIAHSELGIRPDADPAVMHAVQLWIALPDSQRHIEPSFEHHANLPRVVGRGFHARVFAGEFHGLTSPATKPMAGEGVWQPTKIMVNGQVAIRITRVRPDNIHTSFLDTLIWMDPKLLAFQQIPGTLEPTGHYDHGTGMISQDLRQFYVAGINGGYKTVNMHGGFYYKGQTVIPLRDNVATLLTYPDGSIDVANWGHDKIKPGYISARQNLPMLVENGKNQVTDNNAAQWGSLAWGTASGGNFVWRSAIGVRADGTVVHLVGPSMSQSDLADLMVRAGAVRAMCLDMNNGWASSFLYGPYGKGVPVDPQIPRSPSRFLLSSTRDFIAVFAKSPATPAN